MSLTTIEWMSDLVSWHWGEEVMIHLMWTEEIYLSQAQGPFLTDTISIGLHNKGGKWMIALLIHTQAQDKKKFILH